MISGADFECTCCRPAAEKRQIFPIQEPLSIVGRGARHVTPISNPTLLTAYSVQKPTSSPFPPLSLPSIRPVITSILPAFFPSPQGQAPHHAAHALDRRRPPIVTNQRLASCDLCINMGRRSRGDASCSIDFCLRAPCHVAPRRLFKPPFPSPSNVSVSSASNCICVYHRSLARARPPSSSSSCVLLSTPVSSSLKPSSHHPS